MPSFVIGSPPFVPPSTAFTFAQMGDLASPARPWWRRLDQGWIELAAGGAAQLGHRSLAVHRLAVRAFARDRAVGVAVPARFA
jgi:hypothetical protein